ncbi:MAG: prolipoprotein diacylglyceryl transferase [Alphaproteobacteria bacterium]|nr:prolipoprotein diacylglyceryl transferase [Alphaproteobacteria bacterium]
MYAIPFPVIDPVAIEVGPIVVRWYALAYVAGILLGWRYGVWLCRRRPEFLPPEAIDDIVLTITLGIVLGGRLGYVLFYNPAYFLQHPLEALMIWQGGMSYHGGMLGVFVGVWLFARRHGYTFFQVADIIGMVVPWGLMFGRLANFINGELFGRVTDVPWAMVFPHGGPLPRHPSQLYEAALEGLLLLLILHMVWARGGQRYRGLLSGIFMAGYGTARFVVEFAREPDAHLGTLAAGLSMGQLLSLPMIAFGAGLILYALRRPPLSAHGTPAAPAVGRKSGRA